MTPRKIHEDIASIVLIGSFNPAIFQPAWLAAKGLVRESEASGAIVDIIHPEVAQYRVGGLQLSVTRDRFAAQTVDPSFRAPLRDLVVGIFSLLEQTPTSRLGLNRAMHIGLVDERTWHAFGHVLAPKDLWRGVLEKPGMRGLVMEGERTDGLPGRSFFRVEPSTAYPHAIYVDMNSEYDPDSGHSSADMTSYFLDRIRADWEQTMHQAGVAIETLVNRASGGNA